MKEQEFFILGKGFSFYFYGSNVTCMHKVLKCFQHSALSLCIVIQATKIGRGILLPVRENDYCLFQ